jgi:hypothetical protein
MNAYYEQASYASTVVSRSDHHHADTVVCVQQQQQCVRIARKYIVNPSSDHHPSFSRWKKNL